MPDQVRHDSDLLQATNCKNCHTASHFKVLGTGLAHFV